MSTLVYPPLRLVDGKLQVSPSQLGTMKTCFQMWAFRDVLKRVANVSAAPRDAGKAFHAAIETGSRAAMAGVDAETAALAERAALAQAYRTISLPDDEYRTEGRFAEVLTKYRQHWQQHEPFKVLAVEMEVEVEMGSVQVLIPENITHNAYASDGPGSAQLLPTSREVPVVLRCIIDRLIHIEGSGLYVMDTKTMNRWGAYKQDEWERATQPKLYCFAINKLLAQGKLALPPGIGQALGFVLDAVVVRAPSESSRTRLAREEFKRIRYHYTPEQIEECRTNALGWVQAAVEQAAAGQFLQNEGACAHHFGKRCSYWDVCQAPTDQRPMILASDYFKDKEEKVFGGDNEGDSEA